jgi:hypothetical protein
MNMIATIRLLILISAAALLVDCDGWSMDSYWHSDDYLLIAVDTKGQMNLSVDVGNGGAVGIVGPTVFSLGANDEYIVVKQHPATDHFGHFDRTVTNYFVVKRMSGPALEKENGVRGPFTKDQFDKMAISLSLPTFTKTFDDLN